MKFKQRLKARGYPENIIERYLTGVNFASRQSALTLTQKPKDQERLLPFVTMYHLNIKQILMEHWSLIHNHPLLKTVFTKPPIISYKRENPLKKCLRKQKYNLKVIMRRDHKSYIGYPSRSVFTFIPQKECATCTTAWLQLTTTISLPPSVNKKQ